MADRKVPLTRPDSEFARFKKIEETPDVDLWACSTDYEWSEDDLYRVSSRSTNKHDHSVNVQTWMPQELMAALEACTKLGIPGIRTVQDLMRYGAFQATRFILSHKLELYEMHKDVIESDERAREFAQESMNVDSIRKAITQITNTLNELWHNRDMKKFKMFLERAWDYHTYSLAGTPYQDELSRELEAFERHLR